jgi:GntR family histidine utilization transcriptional repressor
MAKRGMKHPGNAPSSDAVMPMYQRAKSYVISQIASGRWRPNDRIFSEQELAKMFGISRMTANRAMAELASEGHVVRLAGVGTFAADRKPHGHLLEIHNIADEIAERGHRHTSEVIEHEAVAASHQVAREFSSMPGARLFHSLVVHRENDDPIQVEDRYVSPQVAPEYLSVDLTARTANQYLMEVAPLAKVEHVVSAILPPRRIAKLLGIRPEQPCLLLHRRTWSQGNVASIADLYHPGDRYDLVGRFRP